VRPPPPGGTHRKLSLLNRLWQATTENVRRTIQTVQRFGRGVGMALVAAGAVVAVAVYRHGKRLERISGWCSGSGSARGTY